VVTFVLFSHTYLLTNCACLAALCLGSKTSRVFLQITTNHKCLLTESVDQNLGDTSDTVYDCDRQHSFGVLWHLLSSRSLRTDFPAISSYLMSAAQVRNDKLCDG